MLREHSEAHHTHIDPDVGLLGARGRLLPQEQQVPREQLQLRHVRLAVLDHLQNMFGTSWRLTLQVWREYQQEQE